MQRSQRRPIYSHLSVNPKSSAGAR